MAQAWGYARESNSIVGKLARVPAATCRGVRCRQSVHRGDSGTSSSKILTICVGGLKRTHACRLKRTEEVRIIRDKIFGEKERSRINSHRHAIQFCTVHYCPRKCLKGLRIVDYGISKCLPVLGVNHIEKERQVLDFFIAEMIRGRGRSRHDCYDFLFNED